MKKFGLTLIGQDEKPRETVVAWEVAPHLAVHRTLKGDGWVVTHIPTGGGLMGENKCKLRRDAVKLAERYAAVEGMDWAHEGLDLLSRALPNVLKELRAIARPYSNPPTVSLISEAQAWADLAGYKGPNVEATFQDVIRACETDDMLGYCLECGTEREMTEPDACEYPCPECGADRVYGAQELVIMGCL